MKASTILIFFLAIALESIGQDPVSLKLVSEGERIVKAGTNYSFTEGPSVLPDGKVYFTDQPNNKIWVWDENAGVQVFLDGSERSNGTFADKKGNFYACADLKNRIIRILPDKTIVPVYDKGYEGMHFNGPNDLWISREGGIFFTDPYYHRPWWNKDHQQLLTIQGVYFLAPGGEPVRIIDDLQQPNGIVGSPDGKTLYVADIRAGKTWKYTIHDDGSVSGKTLFAPFGSDGMTMDNKGNVYLTTDRVLVFDKRGTKIAQIDVPEVPSNVCFGGKKRNILFITARNSVYTLKMKVKGVE